MIDYSKTDDTFGALKLMFPKLSHAYLREQLKKFSKETKLINRLNNPNNE